MSSPRQWLFLQHWEAQSQGCLHKRGASTVYQYTILKIILAQNCLNYKWMNGSMGQGISCLDDEENNINSQSLLLFEKLASWIVTLRKFVITFCQLVVVWQIEKPQGDL